MAEHDIYLDGKGYMLAKGASGDLVPGAVREQIIDPFTRAITAEEPYARATFRWGDGAGMSAYDGSYRYEWGNDVDARSGRLILAPERPLTGAPYYQRTISQASSSLVGLELVSTATGAAAERFKTPVGVTTIRSLAVLVKRDPTKDYAGATNCTAHICADAAGPKPGTSLGNTNISVIAEIDPWSPFPDRWRHGDWFWLEFTFAADIVVGADTWFWVVLWNNTAKRIWWAYDGGQAETATRSVYTTSWSDGVSAYPLMIKLGYKDGPNQFDSYIRCFAVYRGSDKVERMYAGTNYRILFWNATWGVDGHWWETKTIGGPVLQLLEYNEKLFAACGTAVDFWYSDGSTHQSTAWTQVTGQQSNAFAIHDNLLWKADWETVNASTDGTTWTATAVNVGDPGNPVQAMVSHGGKLFCAKPEGIYEISYPDTYPTSGKPTANLMLDFNAERCPRTWLLDWHSGLYFPGLCGVYELKNGVLRNLWEDKVDENAIATSPIVSFGRGSQILGSGSTGSILPYTPPRSWSPLYDKGPAGWTYAHGTTRGILFARSHPHQQTSDLLWYDGRNWYSMRASGAVNAYGEPDTLAEYITACFMQDAGGGRGWLWWNEGFGICCTEWPTWTDDLLDDDTVEFATIGATTTAWFALAEQTREILLCKVGLVSKNLSSLGGNTKTVKVWYRADNQVAWTLWATFNASPYAESELTTPEPCRRFQLRVTLATESVSVTPVVEQIDVFYQTVPKHTKTHQLMISCGADQRLREGGIDERAASEIVQDLRDLLDKTKFTYLDPVGGSHTVRVSAATFQTVNLRTEPGPGGMAVEMQAIVNLLEL